METKKLIRLFADWMLRFIVMPPISIQQTYKHRARQSVR